MKTVTARQFWTGVLVALFIGLELGYVAGTVIWRVWRWR